jgi:hypothetical protein
MSRRPYGRGPREYPRASSSRPVPCVSPLLFHLLLHVVPHHSKVECPDRAELCRTWYFATRRHRLNVAPLEAENQFGRLDSAAFGEGHSQPFAQAQSPDDRKLDGLGWRPLLVHTAPTESRKWREKSRMHDCRGGTLPPLLAYRRPLTSGREPRSSRSFALIPALRRLIAQMQAQLVIDPPRLLLIDLPALAAQ